MKTKNISTSLKLSDLELDIHLGWRDIENRPTQKIRVDVEIHFLQPPIACNTDNLADTQCYDELIQTIHSHLKDRTFRLIEHLAQVLYEHIKQQFRFPVSIKVQIKKKPSIKSLTGGVIFSYSDQ